ncbi:MAG: prepilin-type N-terminal cleavage/methylation domain-containing protein [Verrucomicrobia bacterium]|nr:prepilin-type N-terminal cleavage/methylation domain-containing protein [Verrucomicrobiota bacterium]
MKSTRSTSPVRARHRGFTLVEILVATTIFGLVTLGILRVFIQALNIYYYDTGKIFVNRDIRRFTTEMTEKATYSNYFRIYPAYTDLTRSVTAYADASDPDAGFTTALADTSVADGATGDCLALVFKSPTDDTKITQIIVYYRSPANPSDPTSIGPVRRHTQDVPDAYAKRSVDQLLGITDPTQDDIVVELSRDLATGKLFYNFKDRSIVVQGDIIQRGGMINSRNAQATNTYNFTVSPRG